MHAFCLQTIYAICISSGSITVETPCPGCHHCPVLCPEGNSHTLVLLTPASADSVASTCTAEAPDLLDGFSVLIWQLLGRGCLQNLAAGMEQSLYLAKEHDKCVCLKSLGPQKGLQGTCSSLK